MNEHAQPTDESGTDSSALLRKILSDEGFRAEFIADRENTLGGLDLTLGQRDAFRNLDLESLDAVMRSMKSVPDNSAAIGSLYI